MHPIDSLDSIHENEDTEMYDRIDRDQGTLLGFSLQRILEKGQAVGMRKFLHSSSFIFLKVRDPSGIKRSFENLVANTCPAAGTSFRFAMEMP